jgi:hypothetical protein
MDLALLATLKERLLTATDFGEVVTYFFDHFGDHAEFIALGERCEHPFLEAVFSQVGGQLFERAVKVSHVMLTRLAEQGFIHGTVHLENKLATVLYFEDIQKGLLSVLWSVSPSETKLVRFTGRPMPDRWSRSTN